jgi:hypothetical protein
VVFHNPLCACEELVREGSKKLFLVKKVTTITCQVDSINVTKTTVMARKNTNE